MNNHNNNDDLKPMHSVVLQHITYTGKSCLATTQKTFNYRKASTSSTPRPAYILTVSLLCFDVDIYIVQTTINNHSIPSSSPDRNKTGAAAY